MTHTHVKLPVLSALLFSSQARQEGKACLPSRMLGTTQNLLSSHIITCYPCPLSYCPACWAAHALCSLLCSPLHIVHTHLDAVLQPRLKQSRLRQCLLSRTLGSARHGALSSSHTLSLTQPSKFQNCLQQGQLGQCLQSCTLDGFALCLLSPVHITHSWSYHWPYSLIFNRAGLISACGPACCVACA